MFHKNNFISHSISEDISLKQIVNNAADILVTNFSQFDDKTPQRLSFLDRLTFRQAGGVRPSSISPTTFCLQLVNSFKDTTNPINVFVNLLLSIKAYILYLQKMAKGAALDSSRFLKLADDINKKVLEQTIPGTGLTFNNLLSNITENELSNIKEIEKINTTLGSIESMEPSQFTDKFFIFSTLTKLTERFLSYNLSKDSNESFLPILNIINSIRGSRAKEIFNGTDKNLVHLRHTILSEIGNNRQIDYRLES